MVIAKKVPEEEERESKMEEAKDDTHKKPFKTAEKRLERENLNGEELMDNSSRLSGKKSVRIAMSILQHREEDERNEMGLKEKEKNAASSASI